MRRRIERFARLLLPFNQKNASRTWKAIAQAIAKHTNRKGEMKKMNVKVLEELPDIALLDYWTGSMAMFGGCIFILFGEWIYGTLFMFLGVILLFSLEPAEYLIETVIDDEVLKAHLYLSLIHI